MRYYVTVRLDEKLIVAGEVVADVPPVEDPDYVSPDEFVRALADEIHERDMPAAIITASDLASSREGVMAIAAWRRGDDHRWDRDRRDINRKASVAGTREDLATLAIRGDADAALLLREGSVAQQVEHVQTSK